MLLVEAIGGSGKSMLTWEWTSRHASAVRTDWAGIFWYSFYEHGAAVADFCRRALAYMTRRPLVDFAKKKQPELSELLLRQLQDRKWLIVLDGLGRVLVTYHRADAAQLVDEQAGTTDEIANRDPCAAIRPQDDDLLRSLAGGGSRPLAEVEPPGRPGHRAAHLHRPPVGAHVHHTGEPSARRGRAHNRRRVPRRQELMAQLPRRRCPVSVRLDGVDRAGHATAQRDGRRVTVKVQL